MSFHFLPGVGGVQLVVLVLRIVRKRGQENLTIPCQDFSLNLSIFSCTSHSLLLSHLGL